MPLGTPPVAAQPQPQQPMAKQPLPEPDRRVVGYITSNNTLIPITREELGDYLIARGGYEKLELFANRKILELEVQRAASQSPPPKSGRSSKRCCDRWV